jgi:putative ABC transport system permease protein
MGLAVQLGHLQTSKLGFNRNHILITNSTISQYVSPDDVKTLHDLWRRIPNVVGVGAGNVPGPTHLNGKVLVRPLYPGAHNEIVQFEGTAGDFFKAYGTSLVVGRLVTEADNTGLDPRHPTPLETTVNVDINEVAVHTFGFKSPAAALGQDLAYQNGRLHVVGVVADQRMDTPEIRIWPAVYSYRTLAVRDASTVVRFEGVADADMRERMIAAWRQIKGDRPISFVTMREALDSYYSDDRRNTRLMAIGSLAAGVIGAIGLFGMAAFSASTRTIEIGIRKSVGASHWQVSRLLVLQFLKPVVLGNILSWPLAYAILDAWLGQFDDRTAVSPWFFLASLGISVTIAVTTVGAIAFSAASVPPSKALRQQ